jgi:hypothetical protein
MLYEMTSSAVLKVERVDLATAGVFERSDLQRLLRDHVDVIAPDTLVISEEFSSWDRSDRRIDLLAVDRQARLVIVELKRTTDDSLADLQALRYAAMVSQMTFDEAVEIYRSYLEKRGTSDDPAKMLLDFLGWPESSAGRFGEDVRIVLAAADFSAEVTSTVLWLNERDLDIRCVRLHPYRLGSSILLDVQQIIPLPEAADYQVQIRQKQREVRAAAEQSSDWTRYDVTSDEGIVWLDYDYGPESESLQDLSYLAGELPSRSVLMVTYDAEPPWKENATPAQRTGAIRKVFKDAVPPQVHRAGRRRRETPHRSSYAPMLATLLWELLKNELVRNGRAGADDVAWWPLFSFFYKDGAPMVTVAGALLNARERGLLEASKPFKQLSYAQGETLFSISIPPLTPKERAELDRRLPSSSVKLPFPLPDEQINSYRSLYRYYPLLAEVDL